MPSNTFVPSGFWAQIDHQLTRIAVEQPDTFDRVQAILLDPAYDAVGVEIHRNGLRRFDEDTAFFAGSGGDATLMLALSDAGWSLVGDEAAYYYAMAHPDSGDELTYIEGDIERGNQFADAGSAKGRHTT